MTRTKFYIDPEFKKHFKNLHQVFLYIIDNCNLRCRQCLYKPNLTFQLKDKEIKLKTALNLLHDFRIMGASKLTIMGGEPTLYGVKKNNKPLLKVISEAKKLGYEYIRIDTNGTFKSSLLTKKDFKKLNEITFSLDGPTVEINDYLRGKGVFNKCVSNIKKAVKLGYTVDITCCIQNKLLEKNERGNFLLEEMIDFATSLKVRQINFHDLFKTGIPRDTWTEDFAPKLKDWLTVFKKISKNIEKRKYKIPVRIPQSFINKKEFEKNSEYYGYCSAKLADRVLVHPNGIIRICSLMIGTPYGVARFYEDKIMWDDTSTNELRDHEIDKFTPCTNQNKRKIFGNYVPLCVSFKPRQKEIVWDKLGWEKKRREKL